MKTTTTPAAALRETLSDALHLLCSTFTLKLIALGSCPVALILLAKAALS